MKRNIERSIGLCSSSKEAINNVVSATTVPHRTAGMLDRSPKARPIHRTHASIRSVMAMEQESGEDNENPLVDQAGPRQRNQDPKKPKACLSSCIPS
jgi:hypothetical protein